MRVCFVSWLLLLLVAVVRPTSADAQAPAVPQFVVPEFETPPPAADPFLPNNQEPIQLVDYAAPVPPSPPAFPESETDAALRQLQARLTDVEGQLKKRDEADKKAAAVKKPSESPSVKVTGFTQLDGGWFSQDPNNIATVGNAQDGVGFRRTRLGIVGKVAEFTNYMFEVDFSTAGRPSFFDIWVEQQNIPVLGSVRAGQYCQPYSVDAPTGFRNLTFLERSLPFLAFVPFRRVGVMVYDKTEDEMTAWAYSGYRTGGFNNAPLGDDRYATDIGDLGGYSVSGRLTHLLQYDPDVGDRYLWHVGGSAQYGRLVANTAAGSTTNVPFYQARTTPEFGPLGSLETSQPFGSAAATTPPVYVDTGRYRADSFNMFGFETVYQSGAFGLTSEFMATMVDSPVGTIFYHGAYVQAAYRLTGENRSYDKQVGTLGKIVPYTDFISLREGNRGIHGWGAWEVAFRWSYVELKNPDSLAPFYLNGTNNAGNGTLHDTTCGITWFLNTHTKLQFNWIHAMLDNQIRGSSVGELFVTRLQVDF